MQDIIRFLLTFIQLQAEIIKTLYVLLLGKNFKPIPDLPVDKKHQKLSIDPLPIFGALPVTRIYDYQQILSDYMIANGKPLKPTNHKGKSTPPSDLFCPYCGAPHTYFYDNNGGKGQFL